MQTKQVAHEVQFGNEDSNFCYVLPNNLRSDMIVLDVCTSNYTHVIVDNTHYKLEVKSFHGVLDYNEVVDMGLTIIEASSNKKTTYFVRDTGEQGEFIVRFGAIETHLKCKLCKKMDEYDDEPVDDLKVEVSSGVNVSLN